MHITYIFIQVSKIDNFNYFDKYKYFGSVGIDIVLVLTEIA